MKKIILTLAIALISIVSMAQKAEFYKAMGETLAQHASCKSPADFQNLGNKFQMIANAETSEWLPLYYHAHCYILMSFMETDAVKRDSYLDIAEKSMNKLLEMVPTEAEVFALQSFFYTGRLVVNPMERGRQYSGLSGQAIGKALALDPGNPRAQLMKLQIDMGSARFYGTDPNSFCPQAKEILAKWDEFKPKSPLHPNWGKDQLESIVKNCK